MLNLYKSQRERPRAAYGGHGSIFCRSNRRRRGGIAAAAAASSASRHPFSGIFSCFSRAKKPKVATRNK
ncbi:Hypothetical protein NTJ_04682 [Nesidiocoris tenuis]|uniref:Uncharacterized protein n=1 Tax=Nesidiocoris tenuis TaxID=355587 RepID=A0ABN7AHX8_9HEMI|nr:Hypothetical protein NTJ_04682 [Nesidiocoris tenuis]